MTKRYRLIMVDVLHNNNKFWFADIDGNEVKRTWGRVGGRGQTKTFTYATAAEAERVTERTAQSKFKKGYKEAQLLLDDGVTQVGDLQLQSVAQTQIDTNGCKETASLIDYLVKVNVHTITANTSVSFSGGQLKTPLGIITKKAIGQARQKLDWIAGFVDKGLQDNPRFDKLVQEYLTLVPTKVGRKLDPKTLFQSMADIRKQYAILDSMDAVVVTANGDSKTFSMQLAPADSNTIDRIKRLFNRTQKRSHRSYGMRIKNVHIVSVDNDQFDNSVGNVQELWHGTNASNLLAIFRAGLKIIPSGASHVTGRMFGNGLYFSDQSTKALNYATTFWGGKSMSRYFMLLCDVAMGRSYVPSGRCQRAPSGYDSTFAKAHRSGVYNNEMIVYKENQAKIRFLVEFEK